MIREVQRRERGAGGSRRNNGFRTRRNQAHGTAQPGRFVQRGMFGGRQEQFSRRSVPDRMVVALGRAAGEQDLFRLGADEFGYLFRGAPDGLLRRRAERVEARRIAEDGSEIRLHRFDDFRGAGGGRVVIEIDHYSAERQRLQYQTVVWSGISTTWSEP